jgi:hypothetical protein
MPGPGQGKRAHKKKWCENASKSMAVHPVTTTATAPTTSPEEPAANDANNAMRFVDTATTMSTLQSAPSTYMPEEIQTLLDEAQLEGRKIGYEDGFEDGLEDGKEFLEDAKLQSHREGRDEGYKQVRQDNAEVEKKKYQEGRSEGITRGLRAGEYEEQQKWLAEGHGPGLCISKEAHTRELWQGAILLDDAQVQTNPETTTWSNVSTQIAPKANETASQTNNTPEHQCAALQMEPLDNEGPTSLEDARTALCVEFSMQTTTKTTEATTQTKNNPTAPVTHLDSSVNAATSPLTTAAQPPSALSTLSTTATTAYSPALNQSPAP